MKKMFVCIRKVKGRFEFDMNGKTGMWNDPVPADKLWDTMEEVAYYVENDLGFECNFYIE